jgi:hypothetical protein
VAHAAEAVEDAAAVEGVAAEAVRQVVAVAAARGVAVAPAAVRVVAVPPVAVQVVAVPPVAVQEAAVPQVAVQVAGVGRAAHHRVRALHHEEMLGHALEHHRAQRLAGRLAAELLPAVRAGRVQEGQLRKQVDEAHGRARHSGQAELNLASPCVIRSDPAREAGPVARALLDVRQDSDRHNCQRREATGRQDSDRHSCQLKEAADRAKGRDRPDGTSDRLIGVRDGISDRPTGDRISHRGRPIEDRINHKGSPAGQTDRLIADKIGIRETTIGTITIIDTTIGQVIITTAPGAEAMAMAIGVITIGGVQRLGLASAHSWVV